MKLKSTSSSVVNPILWTVFIVYVFLSGYIISHHELWMDELHSWNIAKGSDSFLDLIRNRKYEGHPPVWYILLWTISKFTHHVEYIQWVHIIIADIVVFLILFFSPFPLLTRILVPFGYYFLYEYAALSRNYAIAILFIILICLIMHRNFRYKNFLYYLLLLLAANTHLIALLLAISVHIYFLLLVYEQNKKKTHLATHLLAGSFIFLSAIYFIIPPSEGELSIHFFLDRWNIDQLKALNQLPLRAFIPVPAWWTTHLWNTQVFLELKNIFAPLRFINYLIVLFLLTIIFYLFRNNRKSLILFFANISLSFIVTATSFTLTSARYSGFIFIGFIVVYWLSYSEKSVNVNYKWVINAFLGFQIIAAVFVITKDIRLPFSNMKRINDLLTEVPKKEKIVTDYRGLIAASAYADKPFYCIELQKEVSFILWGKDIVEAYNRKNRYTDGINKFLEDEGITTVYMASTEPLQNLIKVDSKLSDSFRIMLVDKREGAIEKSSNLFLYRISKN